MISATVLTSAGEIRYRRAGRGASLLLLTTGGGESFAGAFLLHHLAQRFRVVAPDTSGGPRAVGERLGELVDGLGLERPLLVADEAFGPCAMRFALLDPERVGRLAVVCHDPAAPAVVGSLAAGEPAVPAHPLLLLSVDLTVEGLDLTIRSLGALDRFLEAGER